jgi:deoxyribodipyrimidine photo-lyase
MLEMKTVPDLRLRACNEAPVRPDGDFVLYWMIAFRRTTWNFSLQRAVEWARQLQKPLVILEALRIGYRWASDRIHRFVMEGMADNARRLRGRPVLYYPYVEPSQDADKGLLAALAAQACVIVTDDFPSFFLPRMVGAAAQKLPVRLEQVDSNGLLPLRATDRVFTTAFSFRTFLQKNLRTHLNEAPDPDPLASARLPVLHELPRPIRERWPRADSQLLDGNAVALAALPIDHSVGAAADRGGPTAAQAALRDFLECRLPRYAESANHPDEEVRSGLSAWLHFGHISSHQIFRELMDRELWAVDTLADKATGKRTGWWGVSGPAEAFLDQFATWRELGYNMSAWRDDHDRYESLPDWARSTLAKHEADPRQHLYTLGEFATARTHDAVWNAAQTQLVREGRLHNYMRMLWGKKILEWSRSPREALAVMIEMNNKYALDGRNPNSFSGIFWVLGRYDRPWGPERPIFGTVRYMSSENTLRKLKLRNYLSKYGAGEGT